MTKRESHKQRSNWPAMQRSQFVDNFLKLRLNGKSPVQYRALDQNK
ncbi:hypothetical protein [Porphyromonas pogonae]|nr:hypothetical protein [Porphyromonas pogonae]